MSNQTLNTSIKLYRTRSDNLLYLFMGVLCIGLFVYNYDDGDTSILFIINLLGGLIFLTDGVITFIRPKPALIIHKHGIEKIPVFGRTDFITFDNIQNMTFDYQVHKGSKKWRVQFTYANNKTTILKLHSLMYKNIKINEKQIFDLIEQVYQNKNIISLSQIDMDIHDHIATEGYIVFGLVISFALLVSMMMAYLEWLN